MTYYELKMWKLRNFEENVKRYGKEFGIEITKSAEENLKDSIMKEKKES